MFKTFFPLAIQLEQIIKIGLKSTQKPNKERVQKLSSKRMPTAPTVLGMARKLKGVAGSFYFQSLVNGQHPCYLTNNLACSQAKDDSRRVEVF